MRPADIFMRVGAEYYPSAGDFIAEAMRMGACKRLPSVPTGAVRDVTRVFLVHPRAIVSKPTEMNWNVLFEKLNGLAETDEEVREALRGTSYHRDVDLLARVYATKDPQAQALLKKSGVRFHPGIIGYFYMAQIQGITASEDAEENENRKAAGVVSVVLRGEEHR